MPSLISQMRNGTTMFQQQLQPQQPQQDQLRQSIEQVRGMMQQIKGAQNQQAALAQMLSNNPNTATISSMLKSNGNLESLARQMAEARGIDIMDVINQLQGGL